ncbi:MAG: hypothetical protein ABI950_11005 [Solirubrobacteraceae bacterium]
MPHDPDLHPVHHARRDASARAITAVGLLGIGLIHLLDSIGKYSETRYLFWMYVALIAGSIVVAAAVVFTHARVALVAAAALAASALVGFVLSRTTGMPNATGDIGNWKEPLGLASMFVEAAVVVIAGIAAALPVAIPRRSSQVAASRSSSQVAY